MAELYPPTSCAASRFAPGEPAGRGARAELAEALSAPRRLAVVCPRPLECFIDLVVLHGIVAAARSAAPRAEIDLYVRCALPDWQALRALPADRLHPLPAAGTLAQRLRSAAVVLGMPRCACLLVGPTRQWRLLVRAAAWPAAVIEIPFDSHPHGARPSEAVVRQFHDAAAAASPQWRSVPGAALPAAAPRSLLIHQGRFHIGDTLWLTPLLRAVHRLLPECRIVVATTPPCAAVLEGNPHVAEILPFTVAASGRPVDPPREALAARRFDAALFAFGRGRASRWLAEAARTMGIPLRVNLEFRAHGLEPAGSPAPFTHEGWFFWGAMRHSRVLLHALLRLDPRAAGLLEDIRPDYEIPAEARRRAAALLQASQAAGGRLVVVAPGALASEAWPAAHFAALSAWLIERHRATVLLAGGPADGALLARVRELALPRQADASGRLLLAQEPLPVFAALVQAARLLVANDSAPIHFADAFGVPTLYFSRHQYLPHSHPSRSSAWALFDDGENRVARITVAQAERAVDEMVRAGVVRLDGGG